MLAFSFEQPHADAEMTTMHLAMGCYDNVPYVEDGR